MGALQTPIQLQNVDDDTLNDLLAQLGLGPNAQFAQPTAAGAMGAQSNPSQGGSQSSDPVSALLAGFTQAAPSSAPIAASSQGLPFGAPQPPPVNIDDVMSQLAAQPLPADQMQRAAQPQMQPQPAMTGGSPPPPQASAQPMPTLDAKGMPVIQRRPIGLLESIGDVLTGGWPTQIADENYKRSLVPLQQAQIQRAADWVNQNVTDPQQRALALQNPLNYVQDQQAAAAERMKRVVLTGGQTLDQGVGPDGTTSTYTAPLMGVDNGRLYTQTPGRSTITGYTGPQVGANGLDARTGYQYPVASNPVVPLGSVPWGVVTSGNAPPPQDPNASIGTSGLPPVLTQNTGQSGGAPGASSLPPALQNAISGGGVGGSSLPVVLQPQPGQGGPSSSGPLAGANPAVAIAAVNGGTIPRGLRNNNVANVRALPGGQMWRGQVGTDAAGYAQFDTPANGYRAAARNLQSYGARDGVQTVRQAISRWAPASAGNATDAYTQAVSSALGVSPDAQIDLSDPKLRGAMVEAMGAFENGPRAYARWIAAGRPNLASASGAQTAPQPPQGGTQGYGQPPASASPAPAPYGFSGGSATPLGTPRGVMDMGNGLQRSPTGETSAMPNYLTPKDRISAVGQFQDSPTVKDFNTKVDAYNSLTSAMRKMTNNNGVIGAAAFGLQTRGVSGGVERPATVRIMTEQLPLGQEISAWAQNKFGADSKVTPEMFNQILAYARTSVQTSQKQAQRVLNSYESQVPKGQAPLGLSLEPIAPEPNVPWLNPNAGVNRGGDGAGGSSPPAPGQRLTPAQAAGLPPGTPFIGTDGVSRIKR